MKLRHDRYTIHPRVPFSIARGTTAAYERVRVVISDGRLEGWGEAAPIAYYGESADTVVAALSRLAAVVERHATVRTVEEAAAIERELLAAAPTDASARSAVSAALHDLAGKHANEPVWRLFGLEPMLAPPSSFTIAISTDAAELTQRVDDARRYPLLKVKLGTDRDEWIVRAIRRAAPHKRWRADANAAWTLDEAKRMAGFLAEQGCELIEQPLPPDDLDGLRALSRESPIPVIADESCRSAADIPRLDGVVSGINIKLSKCGGLAEARRMALDAAGRGLLVMLGCMIESSLGISAMAQLAPLANFADLDGAALLSDDPFTGVSIEDGIVRLRAEPGLGVGQTEEH